MHSVNRVNSYCKGYFNSIALLLVSEFIETYQVLNRDLWCHWQLKLFDFQTY
jgi:hypothetical protein